ncbi:hypothetical protein KFK09_029327 [Dendrobium nobile]|uniref:FAR1 domain-containing protein n=1 Tax=Dendrobium nobile TaxID=94219 RepID=A0A8T3A173_DENNO|nr:hypothetical protein KFK09_029327 [Dendrobium nobile]
MKMKIDLNLEEDVCFYEQTIFSQGLEEADNLKNVDVQETSANEAEHLKPVRLDGKFSLSDVYVNEKEAYKAYCNYDQNLGFSIRKDHHNYWPNSRNLKSKNFVCSKVGFKKLSDLNIQRKYRKSDTRTGCSTMIRFTVDEAGYWKVKIFIENHNHDLLRPEDRYLLRSCRFAYEMSTRAQLNEEGEEFILASIKDTSEKLDLIVYGKRKNKKSTYGGSVKLKDPLKRRSKGISNARLKNHWEKKPKRLAEKPFTITLSTLITSFGDETLWDGSFSGGSFGDGTFWDGSWGGSFGDGTIRDSSFWEGIIWVGSSWGGSFGNGFSWRGSFGDGTIWDGSSRGASFGDGSFWGGSGDGTFCDGSFWAVGKVSHVISSPLFGRPVRKATSSAVKGTM